MAPNRDRAPRPTARLELFAKERAAILAAVSRGQSVLLIGESGSGKTELARSVLEAIDGPCGYAIYTTTKETIEAIAKAFRVPLAVPGKRGDRPCRTEELKAAILAEARPGWVLACDRAESWAQSLRFWLAQLEEAGVALLLIALRDPGRDIFLRRTKIEMSLPSPLEVREVMQRHAEVVGYPLTPAELADLQQRAGLNLGIAKLVVEQAALGILPTKAQHRQTIAIAPYVVAALGGFAVLRFWGLSTGDRFLYAIGGVCLSLFFVLRSLGRELNREQRGLGQ